MIGLLRYDLRATVLQTRIPFRYGIATMTRAPHVVVVGDAVIDRRVGRGFAADIMPPKWFTKDPESSYADDLVQMERVIHHAAETARWLGTVDSVFGLWQRLESAQQEWAASEGIAPLLATFGVSLIERTLIDAHCRVTGHTFAHAVRENSLGIDLAAVSPELEGLLPADLLPTEPRRRIAVRHTVGLSDPLTDDDIPVAERCNDALPQSLRDCIHSYDLHRLKIKLSGDVDKDLRRLRAIAELAPRQSFTLDGNEQYHSIKEFRNFWAAVTADEHLTDWLRQLLFVEQPIHRATALSDDVGADLLNWPEPPAIIIDESDGSIGDLDRALECGYAGASHKNCKGVFKGIINACKLAHRDRSTGGTRLLQSSEDLTNVGPIALLQDLAVAATLGITHSERNGHHYFAGVTGWPAHVGESLIVHHRDLYERQGSGLVAVAIVAGHLSLGSVLDAPFGTTCTDGASELPPLDEVVSSFRMSE